MRNYVWYANTSEKSQKSQLANALEIYQQFLKPNFQLGGCFSLSMCVWRCLARWCWCVGVLVSRWCWCLGGVGVSVVLVSRWCWCLGGVGVSVVLVCWCVGVLVCCMLVCWCVGVLVCLCVGVLLYWFVGVSVCLCACVCVSVFVYVYLSVCVCMCVLHTPPMHKNNNKITSIKLLRMDYKYHKGTFQMKMNRENESAVEDYIGSPKRE